MRTILTLIAVIFFGTMAIAQEGYKEEKVATTTKTIVLKEVVKVTEDVKIENGFARLYMFKNSRVKKALAFRTKRNKSKLA